MGTPFSADLPYQAIRMKASVILLGRSDAIGISPGVLRLSIGIGPPGELLPYLTDALDTTRWEDS